MKKIIVFILLLCLFPIITFAKTPTAEIALEQINHIENVQVDEAIIIKTVDVLDENIEFVIERNGIQEKDLIDYEIKDNYIVFGNGIVKATLKDNNKMVVNSIEYNDLSFYLYSILESMTTSPYEEQNYYNATQIRKQIESMDAKQIEKIKIEEEETLTYQDNSKTFGLDLMGEKNSELAYTFHINYKYYYDSDYAMVQERTIEEPEGTTFTNPSTGNYSIFVTWMLVIVLGIAGYTYMDAKKSK